MADTERDKDQDGLAAEYVLGTLDEAERADVERRLKSDSRLNVAVASWARRLEPLLDRVRSVEAPPGVLDMVFNRIAKDRRNASETRISRLERRVRVWRGVAAAATAVAASLVAFMLFGELPLSPEDRFVAVLESDDRNPAFVATVDLKRKTIAVLRLGSAPASGHSYQLWALGAGRKRPQSLGVIDASAQFPVETLGQIESSKLSNTVFAISLEPEGGSPTDQPTGPVVFTGKLVPVGPR